MQDKDHTIQVEELKGEVTGREMHIKNLKDEVRNAQADMNKLMLEIDTKGREILKIRSDATMQLK